jgi:hypothetical protein
MAIKSVTDPTKSRSKKFPNAPPRMSVLPKNSQPFCRGYLYKYHTNQTKMRIERVICAKFGTGREKAIPVLKVREKEKIF